MILNFKGNAPQMADNCFIADNATIIGDVKMGDDSSVFFNSVVRGDINGIEIGERSNIQDNCVLHVSSILKVKIGNEVSVGHSCNIHACTLGDKVLVGMGSIIMDGVEVGTQCIIGAGSLLPKGKKYPPQSLIIGTPARAIRLLTADEIESLTALALKYVGVKNEYLCPSL